MSKIAWCGLITTLILTGFCPVFAEEQYILKPVPVSSVRIEDSFWRPLMNTWNTITVADVFDKFEKDGAFRNFRSSGREPGGET
jgi:hypothetical protein